ncbi:hypothetical protein BXZ70DRAFT_393073 [Cristinia sonorae]|uniref:Uncharacterized protein n=1 Tax=Cristinia sonorae TaxID=1940300 RepID=A0A8K0XMG8_9AGAR|nr:hypothetical protein BXZ70DRAFT_393073 [Cristinia sonorae]
MMAYVPPSRRMANASAHGGSTLAGQGVKLAPAPTVRFYSTNDMQEHLGHKTHTLIPDTATPTDLRAIILFKDQHPDWSASHKIFCKSNLDLLRGPQLEEKSIPVFMELPFEKKFEFNGYWKVKHVRWVQPNSPELVGYLNKKFNPPTTPSRAGRRSAGKVVARTEEAWKKALEREWAIVTLEKDASRLLEGPPF